MVFLLFFFFSLFPLSSNCGGAFCCVVVDVLLLLLLGLLDCQSFVLVFLSFLRGDLRPPLQQLCDLLQCGIVMQHELFEALLQLSSVLSCLLAVVISVLLPSVSVPVVVCPFFLVREKKENKFSRLRPSLIAAGRSL